ncbi:hypothetical protein ACPJXG_28260 [Janthinobacterium sp. NFX145]|uniref:hypothetical protein n=1 Tax=Janthinobacterium sp. NFX145 TaxID=3415602 RepID=UPI003CC5F979
MKTKLPRRSPRATAQLLSINAKLYEKEKDRQVNRYRFGLITLRKIANRKSIRASFVKELEDELAELNWLLITVGAEYAIVSLDKSEAWLKLSAKRLCDTENGNLLLLEEEGIEDAYNELFPDDDDLTEDE